MGDLARINTNVAALRAFQTLTDINTNLVETQERISTGKVVNRASDSPSDYYISMTLTRDINAVGRTRKISSVVSIFSRRTTVVLLRLQIY